jgi:hypothetical protein
VLDLNTGTAARNTDIVGRRVDTVVTDVSHHLAFVAIRLLLHLERSRRQPLLLQPRPALAC